LSEDPLGFQAGVNFYAYVGNNPVNFNDPSGNCPNCISAGVSVLLGGVIRGLTGGDIFDPTAIATDAALGFVGAGIVSKATQLYQTRHIAAPIATKLAAGSGTAAQAEITSGIYFFEQGGLSYVGQSGQIGTRLATHVANPIKPISSIDDAVRVSVGGGPASREVAEQFALNNMGGVGSNGVLNLVNPVGTARQGLLSTPGLGVVESIATPAQSILSPLASGTATGSTNFFNDSNSGGSASGGFVIYPSKINSSTMSQVYSK